ncbi:alanyl-tRNA editing protein [Thaumasiovibrio subtropicus]|uniref:alanyl-tRNA editing protein n=2 Tax=Thaumasiovibrio subtropicus TaxID=1891207 RepID=UPI001FEB35F6|nr:alanyl-tRNA editing protein [Thaumasiovibrio subtropicus]
MSTNNELQSLYQTQVSFPQATEHAVATVLLDGEYEDQYWFVADTTPFHPVSHLWPDHPADRGMVSVGKEEIPVIDCQVGAVNTESGEVQIGRAITARRGEPDWVFVVIHRVNQPILSGASIVLKVDKGYQDSLSRGHTAGHLASIALNKVLADGYWRKEAERRDPIGSPDFNSYAQQASSVTEDRCEDTYRLGKTLRKRGLNAADMVSDLQEIERRVNQQLKNWLSMPTAVTLRCEGAGLTDSRYWQCELHNDGLAVMPCGGTHVSHLSTYESITVSLLLDDPQQIKMVTIAKGRKSF